MTLFHDDALLVRFENSPPPVVLAVDVPNSVPCAGCGAALNAANASAVDYRDALCGRYLDSTHRVARR